MKQNGAKLCTHTVPWFFSRLSDLAEKSFEISSNDWFFLAIYKPHIMTLTFVFFPGPNRDNHGIKSGTEPRRYGKWMCKDKGSNLDEVKNVGT